MKANPDNRPRPGDWPWYEVIYRLRRQGVRLSDLAAAERRHVAAFSRVQHRPDSTRQWQIASAIGLSPLAIWPSRYDPDTGRPLSAAEWLAATNAGENT